MIEIIDFIENEWININTDKADNLDELALKYSIDNEVVAYSLDTDEQPHLEYDNTTKTFVLIFHVPNLVKIDNHYETIPMTFLVKNNRLISLTNNNNNYIIEKMKDYLRHNSSDSVYTFLFSSLFLITDSFFPLVTQLNSERKTISNKLKEKTSKKNLLLLSDLETGILYFVSTSKQNVVLLEQIKTHLIYRQLNEIEKEQLDDTIIEAKQLVEMMQLSSTILIQLSSTYNNILNNNLNDTIKTLTILSILLTVPTIVTGFFGMNVPLPFAEEATGWISIIFISVTLWFGLAYILRRMIK